MQTNLSIALVVRQHIETKRAFGILLDSYSFLVAEAKGVARNVVSRVCGSHKVLDSCTYRHTRTHTHPNVDSEYQRWRKSVWYMYIYIMCVYLYSLCVYVCVCVLGG